MPRKPMDIDEVAFALATRVHGNRKPVQARRVDFGALFNAVKRPHPAFSAEELKYNTNTDRGSYRAIFGSLAKQDDFPQNLTEIYASAYSCATLPTCSPWRDYLLTMSEAVEVWKKATNRSKAAFTQAVRDGMVPHYRFSANIRRFRREDLENFIRYVTPIYRG